MISMEYELALPCKTKRKHGGIVHRTHYYYSSHGIRTPWGNPRGDCPARAKEANVIKRNQPKYNEQGK
jgi:hypothetical protein